MEIGAIEKLYYDADGDIAIPTWVELDKIQGASITSQRDVVEIKERALLETLTMNAHKSREITFQLTRRNSDADFKALQDAYEADTLLGFAVATGDIATSGTRAWIGEARITGWDDDQSHDSSTIAVTVRPAADYTTAPTIAETV